MAKQEQILVERLNKEGELSSMKGNYSLAIEKLKQSLEQDPVNMETHYLIGIAFSRLKNYNRAEHHFKEILHSDYIFIFANHVRAMLGYVYICQNNFKDASNYLEKASQLEPNNTFILSMLAYCYYRLDNIDLSIKVYDKVISLEPSNFNAKNCVGYIRIEKNIDMDHGMKLCEEALKVNPNNPAVLDSIGWGLYLQGQNDKAVDFLRKAFDIAPENQEIKDHLKKILLY